MPNPADAHFATLADSFHAERFSWSPTRASDIGLHEHDADLEDFSLDANRARRGRLVEWRQQFAASEFNTLSSEHAADRTWLLAVLDGDLYNREVLKPLETDPDGYVSGLTESAFVLINRDYAPAETRLVSLLSRMRRMCSQFTIGAGVSVPYRSAT